VRLVTVVLCFRSRVVALAGRWRQEAAGLITCNLAHLDWLAWKRITTAVVGAGNRLSPLLQPILFVSFSHESTNSDVESFVILRLNSKNGRPNGVVDSFLIPRPAGRLNLAA
jgi:hypothetical protein